PLRAALRAAAFGLRCGALPARLEAALRRAPDFGSGTLGSFVSLGPLYSLVSLESLDSLDSLASFASGFASFASAGFASLFGSSLSAPTRLRLFSLSPLKSVSYQPAPLRRNTGADSSFFSLRLPQEGHLVRGASVIFCITSV